MSHVMIWQKTNDTPPMDARTEVEKLGATFILKVKIDDLFEGLELRLTSFDVKLFLHASWRFYRIRLLFP
jgi:hypothetical protein